MDPLVTLIVTPRERFSQAIASLESICAHTSVPFRLLYVDVGSPPATLQKIEALCAERKFELIRSDRHLIPNQARNLAIPRVTTRYTLFIDNEVMVSPDWLEPLLACAEETGASIVGPLLLEGPPEKGVIHVAGGEIQVLDQDGKRVIRDTYHFPQARLADVAGRLRRSTTDLAEFHCMLVKTEIFRRLGLLDEALAFHAELDLCMSVREAGGGIYLEPASRVSFPIDAPFEEGDYAYYFRRWSDAWSAASHRRFYGKRNLSMDDEEFVGHLMWFKKIRSRILKTNPEALKWLLSAEAETDSKTP